MVRDLEILASDLLILANSDQIIRMENGENPKHLRSLEQRFLTFLRDRQIYDQIRFINADGKEVVRADLHDNIPGITPADQLQDKSTRYYFKETIGLKPGELYVSPLDLNVENGQVTLPFKPMLRIATLVTNSAGEISGIVILNFLADIILQHFSDFLSQGNEGKYSLVNRDGYWIIGPKKGQEWGFMFGLNYTFQSAYRKEWEQISKLDRGQIQGSDGNFFIFSSIPVKKSLLRAFSGRGNPQGGPIIRETTERERKWIIISHLSTQGGIEVLFKREGRFILISLIAVMCLTGVTLWITAVNRTVRKHSEMALLLLSSGLEHSPAGVILTDNKGTIEFINRRFSEISGYGVEEILGSNPRALKSGETTDQEYADMWKSITSGDTWIGEFHNRRKDDSYYWASASISPIFDAKGEITHFIGVQEDVTEKKAMQEKLQRMATIDALTGALNRRQFFEKLEIELERGRRFDHAMSLLMIDVDHFKKINDKYGHQKGDEVLVEITKIFNKTLRQSDLLGRFGGEEFIIALPETTISESFVLAERLRHLRTPE